MNSSGRCSFCHQQLQSEWKFCRGCGSKKQLSDSTTVDSGVIQADFLPDSFFYQKLSLIFGVLVVIFLGSILAPSDYDAKQDSFRCSRHLIYKNDLNTEPLLHKLVSECDKQGNHIIEDKKNGYILCTRPRHRREFFRLVNESNENN